MKNVMVRGSRTIYVYLSQEGLTLLIILPLFPKKWSKKSSQENLMLKCSFVSASEQSSLRERGVRFFAVPHFHFNASSSIVAFFWQFYL
jgi:hypothetical protein